MKFWSGDQESKSRIVDVGWVIDPAREATFIWDAPHKLPVPEGHTNHAKGISNCPAVTDHEARLIEVTCPIDIKLRFFRDAQGNPSMGAIDGDQSTIRPQQFSQMVMAVHPNEWRHPQRPLIQVITPLAVCRRRAGLADPVAALLCPAQSGLAGPDAGRAVPHPCLAAGAGLGL